MEICPITVLLKRLPSRGRPVGAGVALLLCEEPSRSTQGGWVYAPSRQPKVHPMPLVVHPTITPAQALGDVSPLTLTLT